MIPGILGSKLVDGETGRIVWGAFQPGYADPRTDSGARLVSLPLREGAPLRDLQDSVQPAGVLDRIRVNVLGLPVELNAYLQILGTLGVGGYRDELLGQAGAIDYGEDHYTCFQFGYDWRRDIVESAQRLHAFILEKRRYVQEEIRKRFHVSDADVRFDLVAHSMGGLVARYYVRYGAADLPADGSLPPLTWAGARYVDRVILVAAPNAGSVESFLQLLRGARIAPLLPSYPPAVIGTMPAVYQLMPRPRHQAVVAADEPDGAPLDIFDPKLWARMGWGLASPKQDRVLRMLLPDTTDADERRRIALEHLRKCLRRARRFHAALDHPAEPPEHLRLYLFAGDAKATDSQLSVAPQTGITRVIGQEPGDGTVLRSSALMDERIGGAWQPGLRSPIQWAQVTFLFTDHLGMTKDPAFHDNVLFLLLEDVRAAAEPDRTLTRR